MLIGASPVPHPICILDEPTTGLDPEARRRIWSGVENLTSTGTTVVLTTHYLDEADHLADRLLVLAGGRIVADTTPSELRSRGGPPATSYRLPELAHASDLPACLAAHLEPDGRTVLVRGGDVAGALRVLVSWADERHLDLAGLEVGPPSLEDAYLAAIGQPLALEVAR